MFFHAVIPETPREIHVKQMDSHSVLITWRTSEQNFVTSYYVEYKLKNNDETQLKVVKNQNKTSLTGLQSHSAYNVRVRAVRGAGGGQWSHLKTFSIGQTCKTCDKHNECTLELNPRESCLSQRHLRSFLFLLLNLVKVKGFIQKNFEGFRFCNDGLTY